MQLIDTHGPDQNRLSAYGEGYFMVDERRIESSILISPGAGTFEWAPRAIEELDEAALDAVLALSPEIVVLGTGRHHRFPSAEVLARLHRDGIGVEVMSTDAACRTYTLLASDSRRVVAALIIIARAEFS